MTKGNLCFATNCIIAYEGFVDWWKSLQRPTIFSDLETLVFWLPSNIDIPSILSFFHVANITKPGDISESFTIHRVLRWISQLGNAQQNHDGSKTCGSWVRRKNCHAIFMGKLTQFRLGHGFNSYVKLPVYGWFTRLDWLVVSTYPFEKYICPSVGILKCPVEIADLPYHDRIVSQLCRKRPIGPQAMFSGRICK